MLSHQLLKQYLKKKKSRYGYSLRQLAAELDVSPSFLSRIFSGRKPIPFSLLLRLREPLEIESEVFENIKAAHSHFIEGTAVPSRGRVSIKTGLEDWSLESSATFKILRNWYTMAILEYCTLKSFDGSPKQIAKGLGLSVEVVEVGLRELIDVGLLRQTQNGYVKTSKKSRWGSSKSLPFIRMFHHQMMMKAQKELTTKTDEKSFERRLITGVTVTTTPEKIKIAKKRISEFLHELASEMLSEEDTEVYQLAVQLFPLSKSTD